MSKFNHAAVLGSGSWGTALCVALADAGLAPVAYGNEADVAADLNENHRNSKYLPDVEELPDSITGTLDIEDVASAPLILLVVPSKVARIVLAQLQASGNLSQDAVFLACTKGIELETGLRMHELIHEHFPDNPVAVLSGPSHAEEVAKRMTTAAVIGCEDEALAAELQKVFTLPWFRTYTSTDVGGIELGATVKNIFAIAAGIIDGIGLGDNAKAAMVTRGLAEMTRLGEALGGRPETFRGLSGIGDLIVTCYSPHSRNHTMGRLLGEGKTLEEITANQTQVAEGYPNAESVYHLARKHGIETPIIDQVYAVLYQGKGAKEALAELLSRNPRPEGD